MRFRACIAGVVCALFFAKGGLNAQTTYWLAPPTQQGSWFSAENWTTGVPAYSWSTPIIDNGGTAVIAEGAALSEGLNLGRDYSGKLLIDGGSLKLGQWLSLGNQKSSRGEIVLRSGVLTASSITAGNFFGEGRIAQSGGAMEASFLELGGNGAWTRQERLEDYGRGYFDLSGGMVRANQANVGMSGTGTFRQTGGKAEFGQSLVVGGDYKFEDLISQVVSLVPLRYVSLDTHNLNSGLQPISSSAVTQIGGPSALDWWYPPPIPSLGLYELRKGDLAAESLTVGRTGAFRQSGGVSEVGFAQIVPDGRMDLVGGIMKIDAGIEVNGTLDFGGSKAKLIGGEAILNFSHGITDAKKARISAGPNSLTIFPKGFKPNRKLGDFNSRGIVHYAGEDLKVKQDQLVRGAGSIDDLTIVSGSIQADPGRKINLNGGIQLRSGAQVDLGQGAVTVNDSRTLILGGSLKCNLFEVLGSPANQPNQRRQSQFAHQLELYGLPIAASLAKQSGGSVEVNELNVLGGAYSLVGGTMKSNSISVGELTGFEPGTNVNFYQSGGEITTCYLALSQASISSFVTNTLDIDTNARGSASLQDSVITASLQPLETPKHSYFKSGGTLTTDYLSYQGGLFGEFAGARDRFVQTGGHTVVLRELHLAGSNSEFSLEGGTLSVRQLFVSNRYESSASFAHFSILSSSALIDIPGTLEFGKIAKLSAVPGSTVHFTQVDNPIVVAHDSYPPTFLPGNMYTITSSNPTALAELRNLKLVFEGGTESVATVEAAGKDLGNIESAYINNFALGTLQIGGALPAHVSLVDLFDNQPTNGGVEAFYIDHLIVMPGSTLELNGIPLYYRTADIASGSIMGGAATLSLSMIPEPASAILFYLCSLILLLNRQPRS